MCTSEVSFGVVVAFKVENDRSHILIYTLACSGSSHSAMLIVKNLFEQGVRNIVNIVRTDYRFMYDTEEGWPR